MEYTKATDLKERESENQGNDIKIDDTDKNNDILESLIEDQTDTIYWVKALPLTRYTSEAPAIILDNIEEVPEANVCTSDVKVRDLPSSSDLSVLTSHYDPSTHKWLQSRRASHPFISVKMTKINPRKGNVCEDQSTNLCLMADSGAMCSLLNHETVKAM